MMQYTVLRLSLIHISDFEVTVLALKTYPMERRVQWKLLARCGSGRKAWKRLTLSLIHISIRSREISASIILQSQSQLKAMYKDSACLLYTSLLRLESWCVLFTTMERRTTFISMIFMKMRDVYKRQGYHFDESKFDDFDTAKTVYIGAGKSGLSYRFYDKDKEVCSKHNKTPVSYTHLDVYKRQGLVHSCSEYRIFHFFCTESNCQSAVKYVTFPLL